jgi:adenosylmethionine-8-amino-7-oxononanoate aminotransferase
MRSTQRKNLIHWDQTQLWHPFTQMQDYEKENPLIIEKAKGCYLYDINGKKYLDGISSLWVTVHGHNHPALNRAIKKQLKKVAHSTLLGLGNVPAIQLAHELLKWVPPNLKHVFYSDSGSTAMEIALKMAYQYWQQQPNKKLHRKKSFLTFEGAYHGDTIGSVSLGRIDLFHKVYKDLLFKTFHGPSLDGYRHTLRKPLRNLCQQLLFDTEKILKKHSHHIAGIVIEPLMQGAAGMIKAPSGFLRGLKKLSLQYNVLLIVDEVATGFGRTGKMFAVEHEKVQPDIMAVAKGITGGYLPLAATLVSEKIYKAFKAPYAKQFTFFHGHTYTGNPLACAVALENLNLFSKKNFFSALQKKINLLALELEKFKSLSHVGNIRQCGMMVGIELVEDRTTKKEYPWEHKMGVQVILAARKMGVILRPLGNVIVLIPPLSISNSELKFLCQVTFESIKQVTQ